MPGKGKKKKQQDKRSKNQKKEDEKKLDENLAQKALPKYLTDGLTILDKNVLCEGIFVYTPDGKVELIKNAKLQLIAGRKYGLIGKNGAGKTTLLNLISGYKLEAFPQNLRVMHVRQEANIASDMQVLQYVVESDELKAYLEAEEERIMTEIENGADDDDAMYLNEQLEKIYERLEDIGARTAEARAKQILQGLQFSEQMIMGPTKALSGGWRVRVALACALFVQPDILLLDEPTNHLDFPAVDWLISYLKVYKSTCIIVSHDRGFLNSVITDVMDLQNETLDYYRGDYDTYVRVRDENVKLQQRNYDKQVKAKLALKQFIEEAKRSKNAQTANQAASRQKAYDKMEDLVAPKYERPWSFTFPDPGKLEHALVSLINMNFGWDKKKPPLLKNVNGFVDMKSRIGVLGANGAGKTTLINVLLKKYAPWDGVAKLNEQARTVFFTQHHMEQLNMEMSPLQYVQHLFPEQSEGRIRGFLGHFGFSIDKVDRKISTLSGGQKSRVAFAKLSWTNPHMIIMDEPTNHLDLQTVEALATSLKTFEGGVMLISHDIYFLSQVAETFWGVNGAGEVEEFHDLDQAKAFCYKPIVYKPIDGMVEETKEVREAFEAKKAEEREALIAKMRKEAGADEEIDIEKLVSELDGKEDEAKTGGPRRGKNKKRNKNKGVDMVAASLLKMDLGESAATEAAIAAADEAKGDAPEEESEEEEEEMAVVAVVTAKKQKQKKKKEKKAKKTGKSVFDEEEEGPVNAFDLLEMDEDYMSELSDEATEEEGDEEEESEEETEEEKKKRKKKERKEKRKDKKKKKKDESEEDEEEDEEEDSGKKKKKGKKDKKKKKKYESEDEEEEEEDSGKKKKKGKKDKKKKKKYESEEEEEEEEETPKKKGKKEKKKKKKHESEEEEEVEEEEEEETPKKKGKKDKKKKGKKGKKYESEEEEEVVEEEEEEEEETPKKKKKGKKEKKKKKKYESEEEEEVVEEEEEEEEETPKKKKKGKKEKKKKKKYESEEEDEVVEEEEEEEEDSGKKKKKGKKDKKKKGKKHEEEEEEAGVAAEEAPQKKGKDKKKKKKRYDSDEEVEAVWSVPSEEVVQISDKKKKKKDKKKKGEEEEEVEEVDEEDVEVEVDESKKKKMFLPQAGKKKGKKKAAE